MGKIDYSVFDGLPGAVPKPSRGAKPRKGLERKKGLNPVNRERREASRAETHAEQFDACTKLPCIGCGRVGRSTGHHEPDVSIGGKDEHCVPVCWGFAGSCHDALHNDPLGWWREVGLDPQDVQEAVRVWMASGAPPARFNPRG